MSVPDSTPKGNPAPGEETKSTIETAAELLQQFVDGRNLAFGTEDGMDNRTILLASMLLANAQQLERIADALEARHGNQ